MTRSSGDRRRHPRAALTRSVELRFGGLPPVGLRLLDLGVGGLRGIVNLGALGERVVSGDAELEVTLRVPVFLRTRSVTLRAVVARIAAAEPSGSRELALSFLTESRALARFVCKALRTEKRLEAAQGGASRVAEALRQIRLNLGQPDSDAARVILVTSSVAGEGKTFIAGHLGPLLASEGRRVLLVDTDLRVPSLHAAFGVPAGPGLTDMLAGEIGMADAAVSTHLGVKLLPVGSSCDVADTWSPARAEQLVVALRQTPFDYVVIDSPPLLASAIASTLATGADDVLLVARSGVTRSRDLREARRLLERRGAALRGVVLNNHAEAGRHAYGPLDPPERAVRRSGEADASQRGDAGASGAGDGAASEPSTVYDLAGSR